MFLIYGANGYTGELIAREAVRRGHKPILAGRNAEKLGTLAKELGLESRAFPLKKPQLDGVDAVLHCAGPFVHTSAPMVRACLDAGAHYLDITGELTVFEAILGMNDAANHAGVTLIPGVGFDVVPTDCLAAMLAARLPGAAELELAFYSPGAEISRGTLKTMIEDPPNACIVIYHRPTGLAGWGSFDRPPLRSRRLRMTKRPSPRGSPP
jgi:short subunit dehydrogenase-like uncharacterized protein